MQRGDMPRPAATRIGNILDRAEAIYLRVLRVAILLLATLLLAYAAWLAASSLYKISRSPDSVEEKVASVAADEITDAEMPARAQAGSKSVEPTVNAAHQAFYDDFSRRYYALFKSGFEPYRQKDDKQLTPDEFDDTFLNSAERMRAIRSGNLSFAEDKADLEALLAVMKDAAQKPRTRERLQRYKVARKVAVKTKVQRTRTEYRNGWDSYSTACANWFYDPMGCSVRRAVQTPYTETVTTMEFPAGTQTHTQIFRAFQDKYFTLLDQRRDRNASEAAQQRQSIVADIAEGKLSLVTALYILGGFLVLMFFFLLIAIERHQRKVSLSLPASGGEASA